MKWRGPALPSFFARAKSIRRRVAYSLGIVRLILVPVILLAVYYLFRMGWIVDRIVGVDAMVAMQAERASIVMLDASRADRSYLLLHDAADWESNRQSVAELQQILQTFSRLDPGEWVAISKMQAALDTYQASMNDAVQRVRVAGQPPVQRLRAAVRQYERDLNDLIGHARKRTRSQVIQELHDRTSDFDSEIAAAGTEDPVLEEIARNLQKQAASFLSLAGGLERRSWERVNHDHREAKALIDRAEWVLGSVSLLTLLISIWVSYVLPREVVQPLLDLKAAMDRASAGNYDTELDLKGKGEVADLAHSVRNLIDHLREKAAETHDKPT